MISRKELIDKYIKFFENKNHKRISNSSLIPKEDPSVLFTTAGMQPLVPFLLGQKHPQGKRLVGVQKCIRTGDLTEIGNKTHHTFFEMLGNWSLGDYWKKDSIEMSLEFLTRELKIPKEKISVTCFKGDKDAPKDSEASRIWKTLGINKIKFLGKKDNWWGPAGQTGPCGPDTEMFINNVEIWNNVFMEYFKDEKENFKPAKQKNIDTGMGVERTIAILNNIEDNYLTNAWTPLIKEIENLYKIKYTTEKNKRTIRIIADHVKASFFIASEGIHPSNKEHGYVLRRLIRRAYTLLYNLGNKGALVSPLLKKVIEIYPEYKILKEKYKEVHKIIQAEEKKFEETIEKGLKIFTKLTKDKKQLSGKNAFLLFQSYGFPLEIIKDLCQENKINFKEKDYEKEFQQHQKLSQTASAGRFKSGLADNSETTKKLHTATHLLHEALRKVLGSEVSQKGSNITPERLRFDFSFPRKLTQEEIIKIENLVNEQIKKAIPIIRTETTPEQAIKQGAIALFGEKYPEKVSVYEVKGFSKEICTGPHVSNTKEIGKFKIIKEESSSSGIRRIKATLID